MAGFAAGIGGAGKAAGDYGAQVRSILESRRSNIANAMLHLASEETDPDRRNEYLQHGVDALSGKDMSKLAPALIKTVQNHIEGNKILADAFPQGQGQAPKQLPASVPGQTPGTGSAVQPSTSPVQPNSTPIGGFTPVQHGAAPAPQQQPIPSISPIAGGIPGMPTPQGVQDILAKYQGSPLMQTPAGRKILEPMIQQEVQHSQMLSEELQRQQATMALRQHGLEQMRAEPGYSQLPQFAQTGYEAQAHGFTPINTPNGGLVPDKLQIDTTNMTPEAKTAYGIPADAKGKFTVDMDRVMRTPIRAYPGWAGTQSTTNAEGVKGIESTNQAMVNGGALTAVGGGASLNPSLTTPKTVNMASGEQGLISPVQATAGKAPTAIPGSVVPSLLPHTTQSMKSVQSVDPNTGQPITVLTPVASTRTVGKGGASVPPAQAGNPGGGTLPPVPSAGGTLPRGSISFPKTSENQLNAEGQKSVGQIDDVLSQITGLKKMMEDRGLSKKNDRDYYSEYLKYAHGGEATPNQDIWTGLSFERLRSAAAALKGSNARALPIIEKALEHTPDPSARFSLTNGHLPDTTANMYNKLGEMEKILRTGRDQVMKDQKKSGVVSPVAAGSTPTPSSGTIRVRRKSDGQTGTIDTADFSDAKYEKIK